MLKALAGSLGFAFIAHSPLLSSLMLPTVGAVVAAEAAYIVNTLRRKRSRA